MRISKYLEKYTWNISIYIKFTGIFLLNLCLNNSNAFLEKDSLSIYLSTWNILNIVLKCHGVHRWTPSKLKISVKKKSNENGHVT